MSKLRTIGFICIVFFMLVGVANAAGKVTITRGGNSTQRTLIFTCVGDASTGAVPDTKISVDDLDYIKGWYFYRVIIKNLSTDTSVTDNSDVYIKDENGTDMLNGQGVDELDDDTANYIRLNRKDPVLTFLTLDVDNQATASGKYTVTIIFAK